MVENINKNDPESEKKNITRLQIRVALELSESSESLAFPGLTAEAYVQMKKDQAEFPGHYTPVEDLMNRFEKEGIKIVLGDDPASGNVFILPRGSSDVVRDSIRPKHLSIDGVSDERLLRLISLSSKKI